MSRMSRSWGQIRPYSKAKESAVAVLAMAEVVVAVYELAGVVAWGGALFGSPLRSTPGLGGLG